MKLPKIKFYCGLVNTWYLLHIEIKEVKETARRDGRKSVISLMQEKVLKTLREICLILNNFGL